MFLMLVISRLSIVRIVSAASRIASVVSLKNAVQSTTTRSCVRRSASMMRLMPDGVISSAISGVGGASRTRMPGRVVDHERVDRLDLVAGLLELGHEVGDRLVLRVQVQQDADVAELEGAVDEDDLLAELGGGGDREVDRDRGPADAALGAEDGDDRGRARPTASDVVPGRRLPDAAAAATAIRLCLSRSRVVDLADRGGELVAAERLDEELARAGQHRAAEVVRLALDRHHDDRGRRDARATSARSWRCRPCPAC